MSYSLFGLKISTIVGYSLKKITCSTALSVYKLSKANMSVGYLE